MAIIRGIQDTLNEKVAAFPQAPLRQPVLVNSIPKGGTHLLRNILRMFVPVEQHHDRDFVQIPNMHLHLDAFNPHAPRLAAGHLLFSDQSLANIRHARHILLVRDPYDWVLARARFFVSEEFDQENIQHLKTPGLYSAEAILNMMIFGIHQKSPALIDIYTHNAAAWLGTGVHLVRYEDAVRAVKALDSEDADRFFAGLLDAAGIERPEDWRERVQVGADRRLSRTARENLKLPEGLEFPAALPEAQRRLVDFHAPGLRALLGYA
ncbi:hypothetical protein [Brevundimonas viscosa]|uniref:Sulfotransferase domain-containing protein n=1 Tax=Brevundimonas viscosa TaxID=871741 RepID=A0A1I6SKB3_9CAUL|nr:hypothetical protein [Brevundimonas viscosa]SFS77402.1 hypothetical protein SAMN05192570_2519 [Brevundimonas viscosa]